MWTLFAIAAVVLVIIVGGFALFVRMVGSDNFAQAFGQQRLTSPA
jgi:hypothetical protein